MVPRPKLPGRKPKDDTSEAKTKEAKSKAPAKKAAASDKAKKPPAPNMAERMEGLQGWMAEIERKQSRMTYIGGAAAIVAVLASAAALYLGITNQQDSVDKDDFSSLEQRVTDVGDSLKSSTEDQLQELNGKVESIQGRLDTIEQKQKATDATIEGLQTQINSQATAKGTGTTGTTGTTTTPGTKTP